MLTEWDTAKIEVNGAHELFTPGKLGCPARSSSQRRGDRWKLLESEQMDSSWEKWSSKGGDWWLASVAPMASMASKDWWRRVASIVLVMMMVLRASLTLMETQRNTTVKDLLLLRSWASTTVGDFFEDGCSETDHAKRNSWIQKSETGGQN